MKRGSRHSSETRTKITKRTRVAMADPALRRKISERIKSDMADKAPWVPELARPEHVWNEHSEETRWAFLAKTLARLPGGLPRS